MCRTLLEAGRIWIYKRFTIRRARRWMNSLNALCARFILLNCSKSMGCSSSEALGGHIGHDSSPEGGRGRSRGAALDSAKAHNCALAAQCCEHLNRALVMERADAKRVGYTEVWAVPQPKAGGSFGTGVWALMDDPILVEEVRAGAGLDIGDTLIGMHLRRVAVPVRLEHGEIGRAHVTAALCRPPLIGGERARYQ